MGKSLPPPGVERWTEREKRKMERKRESVRPYTEKGRREGRKGRKRYSR